MTSKMLNLLAVGALVACAGCGTIMRNPPNSNVYGGVRTDGEWIIHGGVIAIIDVPFSLTADTLFLPFDLYSVANPPPSNPLIGWKSIGTVVCKNGEMSAEVSPLPGYKGISDDVQNYVNKLPVEHGPSWDPVRRRWCYWIEDMRFYEDGTGQHAVGFHIPHNGTWWGYALIYDKDNKRVKAVRFIEGHYAS